MHALETAILLRPSGADALDGDAQSEPPHGQLGEMKQAVRGEGQTVVAADGVRQAAFEEEPFESCNDRLSRVDSRASHNRMKREA